MDARFRSFVLALNTLVWTGLQALGTPVEEAWPGVTKLPSYLEFQKVVAPPLKAFFPKV